MTGRPGRPLHVQPGVVRFQDVDAAGIVFYARIFDYFHDGYVAFLSAAGAPLDAALRDRTWAAPLRRAEAEYLRPLRFGDSFEVLLTVADLSNTEYRIGYRLERDGEPAAMGATRHVCVDPATFRRMPLPEALRRALGGGGGVPVTDSG